MYTNKQTDIQTKKVLQQIDESYLNIIIGNNWGLLIPEMDPCHYIPLQWLKPFYIIGQYK